MPVPEDILAKALALKPADRAELIDRLLSSLDLPDKMVEEWWAAEAEDRLSAFEQGQLKAIPLEQVLEKFK